MSKKKTSRAANAAEALARLEGLKTFKVSVEKKLYTTGTVEVKAVDSGAAIVKVDQMIASGKLQTTAVEWEDLEYEDCSFSTTGDVD